MWEQIYTFFRVFVGCVGVVLMFAACAYEDEDRKLQSVLEDWWVRLDDKQNATVSRHAAFMREVARLSAQGLDRLLGERFLSLRAIGVSVCYSISASMLGFLCAVAVYSGSHSMWAFLPVYVPLIAISGFLGTLPLFVKKARVLNGLYAVLLGGSFLYLVTGGGRISFEQLKHPGTLSRLSAFSSLIILGSFGCDIFYVYWSRLSLRWSTGRVHFWSVAAIVVLNCALAFSLAIGPLWWATSRINWSPPPFDTQPEPPLTAEEMERPPEIDVEGAVALFASSNMIDTLAASIFVFVAISLLAHRLLWPVIKRPLYTLQEVGFIGRRKLLASIGLLMLAYAFEIDLDFLKEVFRSFLS